MSHGNDPRGFPLASSDPTAIAACNAGIEGYNLWRADAMGHLDAAGLATCEAVLAHRRGQYARVVELLGAVRHDLSLVGGSHAQRDVFYQLLIDAAHREGRDELVSLFLRDVERIGFHRVNERTLYRDML